MSSKLARWKCSPETRQARASAQAPSCQVLPVGQLSVGPAHICYFKQLPVELRHAASFSFPKAFEEFYTGYSRHYQRLGIPGVLWMLEPVRLLSSGPIWVAVFL